MKGSISEFNTYLSEQVGQPYVWGGQHLKLTPSDYVSIITRKESDPNYREQAIAFCKDKFDHGATVLYAYDCSGLGMYWLQNVKHILPTDLTANGMMGKCDIVKEPKCGYWVFRVNSVGRATHIGYMVSDTEVIEAKGRAYGVVRTKYRSSYWHKIGKPKCMEFDIPEHTPEPFVPKPMNTAIKVKGSVHVRTGNGTDYPSIGTAKNCLLIYLGQAEESPYWYKTVFAGRGGFITSNSKYTELIEANEV